MHSIRLFALVSFLALPLAPAAAQEAQNFPSRPIRIVVPFPAGGPTDILSRIVAQKMSEDFGQAVVIENRPGGDTAIGAQQVAKSPPDGYTLLAAMDTTLVMNPAMKTTTITSSTRKAAIHWLSLIPTALTRRGRAASSSPIFRRNG